MAESVYHLLCTTRLRRWLSSSIFGLLLAAITIQTWWDFHVPGPRHLPLWVYGLTLGAVTGIGSGGVVHFMLWLWYTEHEVIRRCEAYRAQRLSAVLEMSDHVRNSLQVICNASWTPQDAELYAMVKDSVARIDVELRRLVMECDHAMHEAPGHGVLSHQGLHVVCAPESRRSEAARSLVTQRELYR